MSESKLRTQSMDFAVQIINLVKSLKEASETGYWLELLYKTDYITEAEYKSLDSACTSIRVMLISSINTAKGNAK